MTEPGLRERKKQQTRQSIAATAFQLFAEHGFERVTVAEIARRTSVSEATVFNYFPVKEDLVYSRMRTFEAQLVEAVRNRRPGESVIAAFRACLVAPRGLMASADADADETLQTLARIIAQSPALLARERQIYEEATQSLARVIAQQTSAAPGDIEPWVVANALIGVHRALVSYTRDRLLAGASTRTLARLVRTRAGQVLTVLDGGLAVWDEPASAKDRTRASEEAPAETRD
jgi:AcrR family transcriptional regulator